jgi:methyltransferase-like protein/trans-aconitate methyltransferase
MAEPARTPYDEVPYASYPFPQAHPDRLATLGRLFGLNAADPARCRVLELGCAAGGHLIPLALAMPQSQFVGVDLSAVQVAQGRRIVDDLGLANIRLQAASIAELDDGIGGFDYIVAHGVYSWVPNAVQEKILALCASQLNPGGIAYVSYNTLPGWHMRGMIRDLMRYHAAGFGDPAQRVAQARAILDFLARSVPTADGAYGLLLKTELDALRNSPDHYILHEHLEDTNEPLYFHAFAERAARHGLQYLAEAELSTMLASNFPPEVQQTVLRIAPDLIRQEQYMDFLRNRSFRQTLLVRQDEPVQRALTPQRVRPLWISAALVPEDAATGPAAGREATFRAPNGGQLKTANAVTQAAMAVLAKHWPQALPFERLLQEAQALCGPAATRRADDEETLASDLLQCYASGLLELHSRASGFVVRPGTRPVASALARWQAAQGLPQVTTLRHETARIDANLGRLLQLLDGSRDMDEICRTVAGWTAAGAGGRPGSELAAAVRARVEAAIGQIGRTALLVA